MEWYSIYAKFTFQQFRQTLDMQVVLPKWVHAVFIVIFLVMVWYVFVIPVAAVRYHTTPPFALQDIDAACVYHDGVYLRYTLGRPR